MNQRIQELFDKAAYPTEKDNSWATQANFMEKFAQLIAKECLMLADNIRNDCDVDDEPQQALGAAWVALAIARHFNLESNP